MTKKIKARESVDAKEKMSESDVVMNRVLVIMLYTLALLIALFTIHKHNPIELFFIGRIQPVMWVLGTLVLAVAIYYRVTYKKSGKSESLRVLPSSLWLYAAAVFFAVCWLYKPACIHPDTDVLIVAVIASAVCYFVYYMYPVSMFAYTVVTAAGLVMLRLITNYTEADHILAVVARILVIAYGLVIILLALIAHKNGGKLLLLNLGADFKCWFTVVTGLLLAASGIIALLAPALLGYMTIVYVALYFVLIIIGTILMI